MSVLWTHNPIDINEVCCQTLYVVRARNKEILYIFHQDFIEQGFFILELMYVQREHRFLFLELPIFAVIKSHVILFELFNE